MKKTFLTWEEAIKAVQLISYSLEQSIGGGIPSPDELKRIEAENQTYYYASECQTPEDTERFIERWVSNAKDEYHTGSGVGFSWELLKVAPVEITLYNRHAWHKDSTLLSKAWLAGFRGDLDFEYSTDDATKVAYAVRVTRAFQDMRVYHIGFERCLDAVKNDSLASLLIEAGMELYKSRERRNEYKNTDPVFDDVSDDELLGTSTLDRLRGNIQF